MHVSSLINIKLFKPNLARRPALAGSALLFHRYALVIAVGAALIAEVSAAAAAAEYLLHIKR
jgi:hypothetical protein